MSDATDRDLDAETLGHAGAPMRRIDLIMEIAGIALIPIGLTAIIMGWAGAARTGWVFEQVPYLISGGILGLGLLMAAGSLYLASWVSRSAAWNRQQTGLLLAALADLKQAQLVAGVAIPGGGVQGNGAPTGDLVATPRGSMFHRPDCAIVTGRDDLRTVAGDEPDMKPCGMCSPLASPALN